jgi:hypothetical protein
MARHPINKPPLFSFAPRLDNAHHDTTQARIYLDNGRVDFYPTNTLAYLLWLGLPKGRRAAMRVAGDTTPVYSWDLVDTL